MIASASRPWRIGLVSFVVLTLELALIRQLPGEVRAISYFTNLVLMASFFGLGLGCIVPWRPKLQWLLPGGLLLVLAAWNFVREKERRQDLVLYLLVMIPLVLRLLRWK